MDRLQEGRLVYIKYTCLFGPVTTDSKEETEKSVTRQHSSILGDYGK